MAMQLHTACGVITAFLLFLTMYNDVKYILADLALKLTDHLGSNFLDGSDITQARLGYLISPGHHAFLTIKTGTADYFFYAFFFLKNKIDGRFAEIQANCCAASHKMWIRVEITCSEDM